MTVRLQRHVWLAPGLAWASLAAALVGESAAACTSRALGDGPGRPLFVLGAISALAGAVLAARPFRPTWEIGALGGALALVLVAAAVVGLGVLPLLFLLLLFGVWRIGTAEGPAAVRARALGAYLVCSLWFPAAGIALLWAALRCLTF